MTDRTPAIHSLRERIVALDKQHVWHPYTPMEAWMAQADPIVVDRAQGARFWDLNGRSYLDGNASWWTALLGHNHPRLTAALVDQAQRFSHVALAGITHQPAAELAQALVEVAPPGLPRVFFSDDGSTAVEVAIKLALQYWAQNGYPGRRRFVALESAFHGETLGVTALGGVEVFRRPFAGAVMECVHVPVGFPEAEDNAFSVLEQLISREPHQIAAVVMEPVVQGAGGMRIYSPHYLARVRELTRSLGQILILDEVFTGYGRTGPFWASEHAGVAPDILCAAKGFSGGLLPMAATLVSEHLFQGFLGSADRAFYYGHTFCGNPLGARVAREVLAVYRDERVLEGIPVRAARIAAAFAQLAHIPGVARTRTLGMVGALDLEGKAGYLEGGGWAVCREALARGLYLRPLGNTIYITPPLNLTLEELDELLAILKEAVETARYP